MKTLVFFMALAGLVLLGYQSASAQSPCCSAVPCDSDGVGGCTNTNGGWQCNQHALVPPGQTGCGEQGGVCIGGQAGKAGIAQGCVCVGPACVSGPVPPGGPGDIHSTAADCTAQAVAGCRAGNDATCTDPTGCAE